MSGDVLLVEMLGRVLNVVNWLLLAPGLRSSEIVLYQRHSRPSAASRAAHPL